MKEAKEIQVWEYQQNYQELQRKETEKQNERLLKKDKIIIETDKKTEDMIKSIENKKGEQFTKEVSSKIIIFLLKN
jgi:hypothetical protein